MTGAYYNEHDPFAAQWLRNLIAAGHIAPGEVDERSVEDVRPGDLGPFRQVHFFAGIGIWSYAARGAGWADGRTLWTGSCPCQPFSAAGKRAGIADERHLWPAFYHLIRVCQPDTVLGEQVASPDGLHWLEGVQADMEAAGYAIGALDTCAAGFVSEQGEEGFHLRQRLYWGARRLGDTDDAGSQGRLIGRHGGDQRPAGQGSLVGGVGNASVARAGRDAGAGAGAESGLGVRTERDASRAPGSTSSVAYTAEVKRRRLPAADRGNVADGGAPERHQGDRIAEHGGGVDWLYCTDGYYRPVESGTFPLAHEDPGRVGQLRAYGNALDAAQAKGFITAWMECCP